MQKIPEYRENGGIRYQWLLGGDILIHSNGACRLIEFKYEALAQHTASGFERGDGSHAILTLSREGTNGLSSL